MGTARKALTPFPVSKDLTGRSVGRFVIRSKLGAGGMGEVYYAEDTTLRRPVALKRVTKKLGSDPEARQHILREAQRASALSSEHIAAVHDVLEEDGELFLVMEYVDGETLRQRLRHPLTLEQFFKIATQCAEALMAAHEHGIVHCDIKPENIMLTPAGQVKILDFGVAKHLPRSDQSSTLDSNLIGGTPAYMAPEVLLEQLPDTRADIFSLGVVLYEMLTLQNPFFAGSFVATSERILHDTPAAIRVFNPAVPQELEGIVMKAMAKTPAQRYSNAGQLLQELRALERGESILAGLPVHHATSALWTSARWRVVSLLLVVLALSSFPGLWPHAVPLPEKKNLAVLPFAPAVEDPGARAFCRGLTETLTAKLSQLTDKYPFEVVSPGEVRAQSATSVEEARTALGVNLVLEGSFHQSGTRMRVSYDLVDAVTRRVLRADTITAAMGDPFSLEDQVVDSALRALDVELGAEQRRSLATHGTNEPAAYDFYLRGRGYLQDYQKPENIDNAIVLFQHALERDANYLLAYAGLGESYWQKYELTHDRRWVTEALAACQHAGVNPAGYTCLGVVYNGTGRYEEAVTQFERALGLDHMNDESYRGLAAAYDRLGRIAEAEHTYRRSIAIRPDYWGGYSWLGTFLFSHGRYEEAAKMFAQVTTLAPDNIRGYNNLGGVYLALGSYPDAIAAFEHSVRLRPNEDAYSNLGELYLYQQRFAEASQACEQAVKLNQGQYSLWANLGNAYYWQPGRRAESVAPYRKAIALAKEELQVNRRDAVLLSHLAVFHAVLGEPKPAWDFLSRAVSLAPADPTVLLNAALVGNQLKNERTTIAWLRKALDAGQSPVLVRSMIDFSNLHSNRSFQQLLRASETREQ
jgi:serine/threonine-protein kinase